MKRGRTPWTGVIGEPYIPTPAQEEDILLTIETCIDVNVSVQTAHEQWWKFEKSPELMEGVNQGKHINTCRLHGKTNIAGKRVVTFHPISDVMSTVVVQCVYPSEEVVGQVEDGMTLSAVRMQKELKRFKTFVESSTQVKRDWLACLPYHAFF
jgi:hypothetical protein